MPLIFAGQLYSFSDQQPSARLTVRLTDLSTRSLTHPPSHPLPTYASTPPHTHTHSHSHTGSSSLLPRSWSNFSSETLLVVGPQIIGVARRMLAARHGLDTVEKRCRGRGMPRNARREILTIMRANDQEKAACPPSASKTVHTIFGDYLETTAICTALCVRWFTLIFRGTSCTKTLPNGLPR